MGDLNGVMMQFFHWYTPDDGSLWKEAAERATDLARAGVTAVWLPPAYKGIGGKSDVGYGVYDMYDLGNSNRRARCAPNTARRRSTWPRWPRSRGLASRSTPTSC
jgi:hypothetical protein